MLSASACSRSVPSAPALILSLALVTALGCAHTRNASGPPSSVLEIVTDTADADVWVDGEYIGQVSAVSGKLKLAPGQHRVEVRKPGHFPVQRSVSVDKKGGGPVSVNAEMLVDPR